MDRDTIFRPSPSYQLHILIWVALSFVLFILPFIFMAFIPGFGVLFILFFLIGNALWLVPTVILVPVYCRSVEYEFGQENLLVRRGIITRSESMVPYRMVTNVEARRGPIARALKIGTLKVHTAGFSQQAQAEATLAGLADWAGVREQLLERIHAHQGEASAPAAPAATVPSTERSDLQIVLHEILAELRAMRADR